MSNDDVWNYNRPRPTPPAVTRQRGSEQTQRIGFQGQNEIRPGQQSGEGADSYDLWWKDHAWEISPWIEANPGYGMIIKSKAWELRGSPDAWYDFLYSFDWNVPGDEDGGGGGGGGGFRGGGGGGMSAAEREAADIENWKVWLRDQSETLGIVFDDGAITAMATTAVKSGWSQDRAINYIAGAAENWDQLKAGTLTVTETNIKKVANDFLLDISDDTAREYARRIATNELTMETVADILRKSARSAYGFAAEAIDEGMSVRDFLLPARDRLARTLELNPADIDLKDSKWLSMMQTTDDKGNVRAASMTELDARARSDDRFKRTKTANDMAANVGALVRDVFEGRA